MREERRSQVRETVAFFQWFRVPEGRKVGSLKRRVRRHLARWEMKNCAPLWRAKRVWKGKKRKSTSHPERFWQLRCGKSARHYGANHMSKSKCTNLTSSGRTLGSWDVEKVHTPLWCEAHFRSQNVSKHTERVGSTFASWDVQKMHAVVARSTCRSVKSVQNTSGVSECFWKLRCSKTCTPLWREARLEVKSVKNWWFFAFFDVQMSKKWFICRKSAH